MFLKRSAILVACVAIFSVFIAFFSDYWLIGFLNNLFMIGLIFVIIGGFAFLNERKAFVVTGYALKKMKLLLSFDKSKKSQAKNFKLDDYVYKENNNWSYTNPLLFIGLTSCIISSIISFILYS